MDKLSYHRHRFPSIVIQQAIWLYFRFALSYRDVDTTLGRAEIPNPLGGSDLGTGGLTESRPFSPLISINAARGETP